MTKNTKALNLQKRLRGVTMPINRKRTRWGRNWLCLCGSNKKYKNCCINDVDGLTVYDSNAKTEELSTDVQNIVDFHRKEGVKKNG
ncbi:hypothetical protein LCGC14_0219660 [marine sediment metagenome]|uniref:SEC-C motif domain protein n=1 Tax=marine sediment metagenome TaxID=412755 RepID=A0A0F9WXF8_9ZZZZ